MTCKGTVQTISSGELSDSGRDFPHVLLDVPVETLPSFSLGQDLYLVPADKAAEFRQSLRSGELIELEHRLSNLFDAIAEVRGLVEAAIHGGER